MNTTRAPPQLNALTRLNSALSARYDVEREIGAGGMATVYLARDIKHNRRVALKVLRPDLGAVLGVDRFLSEIEVTANLQHPNLLPLFDSGEADGLLFYVMPFIEGESLRARIDREKQLPIDDAVGIATAVASALDYAHRHGVIHRDLKPENILLHEGQPLVADFGIALAVSNAGGARVTQTGLSLGTPQYMSPEQATGDRAIDARTDIYSLGAVAYEMLTGEPPHLGSTAQAVIARVIAERPRPVRATRASVPVHVEAAIERALEKLPADRWASAQEFADVMRGKHGTLHTTAADGAARASQNTPSWQAVIKHPITIVAGLLAIASLSALALQTSSQDAVPIAAEPTVQFELTVPPAQGTIDISLGTPFAISPNGDTYVYKAQGPDGRSMLYARNASEAVGRVLRGTEYTATFTVSPDGKTVAFVSRSYLMRVDINGGLPVRVATVGQTRGITWVGDHVVIGTDAGPLRIVSAAGGDVRDLTTLDQTRGEYSHLYPAALSDGEHVVFAAWTTLGTTRGTISVVSARSGEVTQLDAVAPATLGVAGGHLIVHDGRSALMGLPFDARAGRITGPAVPLIDSVAYNASGLIFGALSLSGTLMHISGTAKVADRELVAVDMQGAARSLSRLRRVYGQPRYSPDGRRIAVEIASDTSQSIWLLELGSGALVPFAQLERVSRPEWSPDGRDLAYIARVGMTYELRRQPSDGSSEAKHVMGPGHNGSPVQVVFTPDGQRFIYRIGYRGSVRDGIWSRAWDADSTPFVVSANDNFHSRNAAISPDGQWVAYASDESGDFQVYVRAYPGPGARYAVSVDGGDAPVWHPDGKRLFYVNGPNMQEATLTFTPSFTVTHRTLFEHKAVMAEWGRYYDLAPDGSHFLMVRVADEEGAGPVRGLVIHNWGAEIVRRTGGVGR